MGQNGGGLACRLQWHHVAAEDGAELAGQARRHLRQLRSGAQHQPYRGDAPTSDAAGDDAPEPVQVHADVEREPVAADPAPGRAARPPGFKSISPSMLLR